MDRFVPIGKKSKKEQKKFHARQRRTWEGLSPVKRSIPSGKAYNRKKQKAGDLRNSSDFRNEKPAVLLFFPIAHFTLSAQSTMMVFKGGDRHVQEKKRAGLSGA